eukprot:gene8151-1404_t
MLSPATSSFARPVSCHQRLRTSSLLPAARHTLVAKNSTVTHAFKGFGKKDASPCPCGSDKPFVNEKLKAKSADDVLKARFTAYCKGNWKYIVRTTHPASASHKGSVSEDGNVKRSYKDDIKATMSWTEFQTITLLPKDPMPAELVGTQDVVPYELTFKQVYDLKTLEKIADPELKKIEEKMFFGNDSSTWDPSKLVDKEFVAEQEEVFETTCSSDDPTAQGCMALIVGQTPSCPRFVAEHEEVFETTCLSDDPTAQGCHPGSLALCYCPGKQVIRRGVQWERNLEKDLARLKVTFNITTLVCLLNVSELRSFRLRDFDKRVQACGVELVSYPIIECAPPENKEEAEAVVDELAARLDAGEVLAVHCRCDVTSTLGVDLGRGPLEVLAVHCSVDLRGSLGQGPTGSAGCALQV